MISVQKIAIPLAVISILSGFSGVKGQTITFQKELSSSLSTTNGNYEGFDVEITSNGYKVLASNDENQSIIDISSNGTITSDYAVQMADQDGFLAPFNRSMAPIQSGNFMAISGRIANNEFQAAVVNNTGWYANPQNNSSTCNGLVPQGCLINGIWETEKSNGNNVFIRGYAYTDCTEESPPSPNFGHFVVKYSITGNVLWQVQLPSVLNNLILNQIGSNGDIHPTDDGGFIYVGQAGDLQSSYTSLFIGKYNGSGIQQWTQEIVFNSGINEVVEGTSVTSTGSGTDLRYFVTYVFEDGGSGLSVIDPNGTVLSSKKYTTTLGDLIFRSVTPAVQNNGEGLFIAGEVVNENESEAFIIKTTQGNLKATTSKNDPSPIILWGRKYNDFKRFISVKGTSDSGCVAAGTTNSSNPGIVKTDQEGLTGCNQLINISGFILVPYFVSTQIYAHYGLTGLWQTTTNTPQVSVPVTDLYSIDDKCCNETLPIISQTSCNSQPITLNPNYSGNVTEYLWNTGATSSTISVNTSGSYEVGMMLSSGCIITQPFDISIFSTITSSITTSSATCVEKNDGSINLVMNSGTAPYTFIWSNGATTQNQSNIGVGNYSVTISDAAGCNTISSVYVGVQVPINDLYSLVITELNNPECLGIANGSLEANAAGGSAGYNVGPWDIAWSNGIIETNVYTSTQSGLLAGNYAVTITDKPGSIDTQFDGCKLTKTVTLNNLGTSSWQEHTNPYNVGDNSNISSMAIDEQENVYVAGIFEGELNIQGQTATTSPNSINEFFVAAFNSCGILKWLNYSESDGYVFDDIQITENGGRIYLANLPTSGGSSINPLTILDGFGSPLQNMPSFNIQTNRIGLITLNSITGAILSGNPPMQFPLGPYLNAGSDLMDLEVGNKIYIAGKLNDRARVLELNTLSNNVLLVLEDANTGNIFNDLELGNNDDLYLVGQASSQPMNLGGSIVQPLGTSDAIIAFHNSTTTFVRSIKASNTGEATGLSLLDNGQMAVVGNYSGSIGSYGNGSIYAPTNSSTGFIANFQQTSTLGIDWLVSLEAPGTQPNWNNNVTYARCTDVSSNENNEVFVFGKFEGSSFELEANSMSYSTPGVNGSASIWNGKFGGFTPTANMSIDWLTSASSPVATPVDMVSGSYNNYIAGDFTDHIAVGGSPIMSTQNPNTESSFIIRFGDQLNPQQGAYYKMNHASEGMAVEDFSLYPNPTSGILNLTWVAEEGTMEFTITDITGRLVYQSNKTNAELGNSSIDISSFESGTYYINFQLGDRSTIKPFIKL